VGKNRFLIQLSKVQLIKAVFNIFDDTEAVYDALIAYFKRVFVILFNFRMFLHVCLLQQ
jgi:hypothetical protein